VLFLLITKFRWHVFLSLLVPILLFATVPGMDRELYSGRCGLMIVRHMKALDESS